MPDPYPQLSVLDRLLDDQPNRREDPPITRAEAVRQLKSDLRRDLEWLLNTRCHPMAPDESSDEVLASVAAYGLPDFSSMGIGLAQARLKFRRALEYAIATFEPRLMNPEVTAVDNPDDNDKRVLRFLITGLLRMDPAPERVSYDTLLELTRGEYKVQKD